MKDMRREFQISILATALYTVLNRFTSVSELFLGFLMGISLCFFMVGLLPKKGYARLKAWKNIIRRHYYES